MTESYQLQIAAALDAPQDAVPADVPSEFQLLPLGEIELADGPTFVVDREAVEAIIRAFDERGVDMVIDYEHQTEGGRFASPDGTAPAAGWIKALEDRGPDGLWAVVEWTDRARRYLAAREYRYFSPVFLAGRDGRIMELLRVGLTNSPRINRLRPLIAKRTKEDRTMDLVKVLAKELGLSEDAGGEAVVEAVRALRTSQNAKDDAEVVVACKEVLEALELPETADKSEVVASIHALRQKPDLTEEVASLKRRLAERERDELVAAAMQEGKITPAQKEWAERYAMEDPEGFRIFISKAPVVVPLDGIRLPKDGADGGGAGPDDVQMHINRLLGIDDETWNKYNRKTA